MSEVTQLLSAIDAGDPQAADQLLPLVYEELRKLAAAKMAQDKPGQTLQATALVHEAWLKIAGEGGEHFANRRHFFKAAASAMQQILIDIARRKQRLKHGANLVGDELHESRIAMSVPSEELLAVNDALAALALEDPQAAEVVQMRYFVGLTVPEIATALVHEAWLKIAGDGQQHFANRRHFFKAAAGAMQQILIDIARRKQRLKHGGNQTGEELHESRIAVAVPSEELLAVNEALAALALEDPQEIGRASCRERVCMLV